MAAVQLPSDASDDERIVDRQVLPVVIHATPRYGRFLGVGVAAGLVVAAVLVWIAGVTGETGGPLSTGASGLLRVYAVYAAACVGVGLVLMGTLALVLGRIGARRARFAHAEHDTALSIDMSAPANDDLPRWVRDATDLSPDDR